MFRAFVINLDTQSERYRRFYERFEHTDLKDIKRVSGHDGKVHRKHPQVNSYIEPFLTDSIIGCGLSHIMLAQRIVDLK